MAELDYYTVMQKRIEYLAKRYDPYDRYSVKEKPAQEVLEVNKPRKMRQKVVKGFSYLFSLLF